MVASAAIRKLGVAAVLCFTAALPFSAQKTRPAPVVRQPPPPKPNNARPNGNKAANDAHLAEWMNQHSNLSPQQQWEELQKSPGVRELPAQTQENMREKLMKLNQMTPEQRERMLERNEAVERMTPEQRVEFRGAMKELADLPPDQRRYVARTFRGLRQLTPEQRANVLASDRFDHLTPEERTTLNHLLKFEPFFPPSYDGTPGAGATAAQPPR